MTFVCQGELVLTFAGKNPSGALRQLPENRLHGIDPREVAVDAMPAAALARQELEAAPGIGFTGRRAAQMNDGREVVLAPRVRAAGVVARQDPGYGAIEIRGSH